MSSDDIEKKPARRLVRAKCVIRECLRCNDSYTSHTAGPQGALCNDCQCVMPRRPNSYALICDICGMHWVTNKTGICQDCFRLEVETVSPLAM